MTICMAFRFVAGVYAATAWNSSANSGTVEWPPSPWRIGRALLAVAHDRLSEGDLVTLQSILSSLAAENPRYLVPPTTPWHTRHYLPDLEHQSGDPKKTTLTLNSMVSVKADQPVYVIWPQTQLDDEQTACLSRCLERLSYLGRAESLVEGSLENSVPELDRPYQEIAPKATNSRATRLLCPTAGITSDNWRIVTDKMRKKGYLTPPGAHWVAYDLPEEALITAEPTGRPTVPDPTVVRWAWRSAAPLRSQDAIIVIDRFRSTLLGKLRTPFGDNVPDLLTGHFARSGQGKQLNKTAHNHAHWLWLSDTQGLVTDLVLWVPQGIPATAFSVLAATTELRKPEDGYAPRGLREGTAYMVGVGQPPQIIPELVSTGAGTTTWASSTPFLRTRHLKRSRDPLAVLKEDVIREWSYRNSTGIDIVSIEQIDDSVRDFRRYRWKESMTDRREGANLRIKFAEPVQGPISMGALSHFGFGLFHPEPW